MKYISLILSLLTVFLFGVSFQGTAQAALGDNCGSDPAVCAPYPCITRIIAGVVVGGKCSGPCDTNTTDTVCMSSVGTDLGWKASSCTAANDPTTATKGVCAELPEKQLPPGPQTGNALITTIDIVTNWVFAIFTVIAVIMVLLAALQFITAGGDAAKVGEARQKLIWAAVGILIALLAKGIVPVLRAILGV